MNSYANFKTSMGRTQRPPWSLQSLIVCLILFSSLAEVLVFGAENVAKGKETSQSSTDYGGYSSKAVDGSVDGRWGAGSVTHTKYQYKPWWEVDLGGKYSIERIMLWNRNDCCSDRLKNFDVRIINDGVAVWKYYYGKPAGPKTQIDVPDIVGSKVRVQLRDANVLSLAEVLVYGTSNASKNIAQGKKTSQSSTGWGGYSKNAVDGNTSGQFSDGTVTHTYEQDKAWWMVDLGAKYTIGNVKIYNRMDCCSDRLSNFLVYIMNDDKYVWKYYHSGAASKVTDIDVPGIVGNKVKVTLSGKNFLSLAEVEVYE